MVKYDDARRKSTKEAANAAGKALDKLNKKNMNNVLTPKEMKERNRLQNQVRITTGRARTAATKMGKEHKPNIATRRSSDLAGGATRREVKTGTRRTGTVNRPGEPGVRSVGGSKRKYGGRKTAAKKAATKKAAQTKKNRAAGRVKAAATRARNKANKAK